MKKRIVYVSILLILAVPSFVYANTLGDLGYWYSDSNVIGRWIDARNIFSERLDSTFTATELSTNVSHARNQWQSAGISTSTTTNRNNANIRVYVGSLENIRKLYPGYSSTATGVARYLSVVNEGSWRIKGECTGCDTYMTGYRHQDVEIYIKNRTDSGSEKENRLKKTFTHELGHGLGWRGHSSNSADIMYHTNSQVTTVTSRDKNHLSQVYR